MNTHRMNITLPNDVLAAMKGVPNKSRFIAEAVRARLDSGRAAQRQEALAQAYRDAAKEEKALIEDWDGVLADGL